MALAAPAFAGGAARGLMTGGRTIAGPGTVAVAKGALETVLTNFFGNDACVTLANLGSVDVTLGTIGAGQHSVIVSPGDTAGLCEASLDSATVSCTGAQAGNCSASWRVDR